MYTLTDWLKQQINIVRVNGATGERSVKTVTILQRYAELIGVNAGSTKVERFGQSIPHDQAPYGRFGLTVQEALELVEYNGTVSGVLYIYGIVDNNKQAVEMKDKMMELLQAELNRVASEGFDVEKGAEKIGGLIQVYSEADMKAVGHATKAMNKEIKTTKLIFDV